MHRAVGPILGKYRRWPAPLAPIKHCHRALRFSIVAHMQQPDFHVVVAATKSMGIGKDGGLPWRLPGEMAYFKQLTASVGDPTSESRNAVIMGRKTWDSLPPKFRPLPGRVNVVLTRSAPAKENCSPNAAEGGNEQRFAGALVANSLDAALQQLSSLSIAHVFVIGGGTVYAEAMMHPRCAGIHLTLLHVDDIPCDTHLAPIDATRFRLWAATSPRCETDRASGQRMRYEVQVWTPMGSEAALPPGAACRHEEHQVRWLISFVYMLYAAFRTCAQYLDMVREAIDRGVLRADRTGTGTFSHFGRTMRFNLRHTFPLLTTKRVFWRGVAQELLWFISGDTSARTLQDQGIHIWDGNGSRAYLDSIGLQHREEGDLGPVYGFQWRHFGAEYSTMHADYRGKGVDQLADLIHRIKTNPNDRRLVLSAWNPAALPEMALPPCHMFCQFYVADGELSCQMYQRSCDLGLGVPFNIASYALLTRLVAQVCGLRAGDFVHVLGDAHVYTNHVDPLKEQLKNAPRHLPVLNINPDVKDIDGFRFEDFELVDYSPHKAIPMKMAV